MSISLSLSLLSLSPLSLCVCVCVCARVCVCVHRYVYRALGEGLSSRASTVLRAWGGEGGGVAYT